jgi:hypothetical protein
MIRSMSQPRVAARAALHRARQAVPRRTPRPWRERPPLTILWLPGICTIGWLILTVSLFVAGPYDWESDDRSRVAVFIAICIVFFAIGYKRGLRRRSQVPRSEHIPTRLVKISGICVFASVVGALLFGDAVSVVSLGRVDLRAAYLATAAAAGSSFWPYVEIATAPWSAAFLPVGLFYWRHLRAVYRIGLVAAIAFAMLVGVSSGRRSGVIFTAIMAMCAVAARVAGLPRRARRRAVRRLALVMIAGSVVTLFYFMTVQIARAPEGSDLTINLITRERPNPESAVTKAIPERWRPGAFAAIFYMSHGYYGLAQSLVMPFEGITFGFGQSWFLSRNADRLGMPEAVLSVAYDRRLEEQGYPVGLYWMTIFPWFASDITFPGTVLLTCLFGYALARSWEESSTTGNPWAIVAFGILAHMAFSMPMNNPLQDGSGLTRTGVVLISWLATSHYGVQRKRFRRLAVSAEAPVRK